MRGALIAGVALCIACAKRDARDARGAGESGTGAATLPAPTGATAKPACPATGRWSECAILERLDRAGLAPQLDSAGATTAPPLGPKGFRVRLSRADLEVYLYDDAASRARDEAKLDKSRFLDYTEAVSMQTLPTLISSSNAIVILHSRNDHQRERVGDAITAGPPSKQP